MNKRRLLPIFILDFFIIAITSTYASCEVNMNFKRWANTTPFIVTNRPGEECLLNCTGGNRDNTPYLEEYVEIEGINYIHQIVGRPEDGWVQEAFIKQSDNRLDRNLHGYSSSSESGSGDPRAAIFRMLMGDNLFLNHSNDSWECGTGFCSEIRKDSFNKKPVITQIINLPSEDIFSFWKFDMSYLNYNDHKKAGDLTNNFFLGDHYLLKSALVNFSMSVTDQIGTILINGTKADSSSIETTGGQYSYNPGKGWKYDKKNKSWSFDEGSYYYIDNIDPFQSKNLEESLEDYIDPFDRLLRN